MATKQVSRSFNRSPEGAPTLLARMAVRFEIEAFPGVQTSGGVAQRGGDMDFYGFDK
jgi:hypothetical protein